MASLFDRFKSIINKNSQNTAEGYNRAIYNWLGESIIWNPENDDSCFLEGNNNPLIIKIPRNACCQRQSPEAILRRRPRDKR